MRSSNTAEFHKNKSCPSAEALLLYSKASLAQEKQVEVSTHLATCDFCGAEMQLLTRHPFTLDGHIWHAEMPIHLRYLAETLLAEPSFTKAKYTAALNEASRLTFTDA